MRRTKAFQLIMENRAFTSFLSSILFFNSDFKRKEQRKIELGLADICLRGDTKRGFPEHCDGQL